MKRRVSFALILVVFCIAGWRQGFAQVLPAGGLALAYVLSQDLMVTGEDKKDDNVPRFKSEQQAEKEDPNNLGARFWGGPYWGYGPRWGHPCQSCRSDCESEPEGGRCKRCRLRCGW